MGEAAAVIERIVADNQRMKAILMAKGLMTINGVILQ